MELTATGKTATTKNTSIISSPKVPITSETLHDLPDSLLSTYTNVPVRGEGYIDANQVAGYPVTSIDGVTRVHILHGIFPHLPVLSGCVPRYWGSGPGYAKRLEYSSHLQMDRALKRTCSKKSFDHPLLGVRRAF